MSNQQWPPPPGNGPPQGNRPSQGNGARPGPPDQSPWAQPDARWSPQSYRDSQARDPQKPFGQPTTPAPAPGIDQFEPPPRFTRKTLGWGVGIVATIVVLVLVLQLTGSFTPTDPTPSASPSAAVTEGASPVPAATGGTSIPFEGNGTGLFEILSQEWTDTGLSITYQITLDEGQGERSFSLYMFTNSTLEVADPLNSELAVAASGKPFTGTVEFSVVRAKSTLVLASGFGAALTALPIPD
ncbi:hypothetical protein [Tessaracoccus antarcticus]|nr:hypothetical protein [Tessaracoccus antarcticus]